MIRKFGLVLVCLAAVFLAACGGGSSGGGAVTLDQTFDADGLSFKYPSGWVTEATGDGGPVYLANSQAALDAAKASTSTLNLAAGQQAVVIFPIPAELASAMGGTTLIDLLKTMSQSIAGTEGAPTFGEPTEATIGGKTGARMAGTSDSADAQIIMLNLGDSGYLMVFGVTPKGDISKLEPVLNGIAEGANLTAATG
ncbi:MAG: hypothetical protein F9K46_17760 [Anaerolineae bacterium]|nr:MAG: hypothetical protein F9K46_17760 [Anaerolineae bacterium]MBZ0284921.1 hypothetical protein [Anaerolineae bacterium]